MTQRPSPSLNHFLRVLFRGFGGFYYPYSLYIKPYWERYSILTKGEICQSLFLSLLEKSLLVNLLTCYLVSNLRIQDSFKMYFSLWFFKKLKKSLGMWHLPVVPKFGRQRYQGSCKFKILLCLVSSRVTYQDSNSKNKIKIKLLNH